MNKYLYKGKNLTLKIERPMKQIIKVIVGHLQKRVD